MRPGVARLLGWWPLGVLLGVALLMCWTYALMPNAYSATHYTFNYFFGFVRRALPGQLLMLLDVRVTYGLVCVVALAVLLAEAGALAVWGHVLYRRGKVNLRVLVPFLMGYGIQAHCLTLGYFDAILVCVALGLAVLPGRWFVFFSAGAVLALAGLAVHEMFVVVAVPVLMVRLLLSVSPQWQGWGQPLAIVGVLLVLLAGLAGVMVMGMQNQEQVEWVYIAQQKAANFALDKRAFGTLVGLVDNDFFTSKHTLLHNRALMAALAFRALAALPVLGFYSWLFWRHAPRGGHPAQRALKWAVALSLLAPVSMCLVALDYGRFFGLACFTVFIGFLLVAGRAPQKIKVGWVVFVLLAGCIVVSLGAQVGSLRLQSKPPVPVREHILLMM